MNYSEDAPKLPKLPFIAGDLVLLATAAFIGWRAASPIGPGPLLAITICVVGGSALAVIPFLANYAKRQDAELTERQNQIAALARTTAESAEQISIAAAGISGIAEASAQNLKVLEQFPSQLQARIDGLTAKIPSAPPVVSTPAPTIDRSDDIARLEAAAEKITRTLAKLETASKAKSDAVASAEKDLAAATGRITAQIEALLAAATTATNRLAELPLPTPTARPVAETVVPEIPSVQPEEPAPVTPVMDESPASAPAPEPAAEPLPEPEPAKPVPPVEVFTASSRAADEVPVDEIPKPIRARKPRPVDEGFDLGLTSEAQDTPETSITSDGFTRLIATAYIGIGNKLFIRGDGPGLSWDKGIPLQFVSIGKWRWETPDATAPFKAKLFKNDQVECVGLGTLTLEPAHQHDVNAGF